MQQDIQNALSSPKVVAAVTSSNAVNVLMAALEVYSIVVSAVILTLSGVLTFYAVMKHKKENRLLDIRLSELYSRRKDDKDKCN
jgi:K+ transporter